MSTVDAPYGVDHPVHDPHKLGRHVADAAAGRIESGPASKRIVTAYGFWIFLLSDIVLFSALFATYAVLKDRTADGPTGAELFNLTNVAFETAFLLLSSFVCGLAMIAASTRNMAWTQIGLLVTGVLGAGFLALELREFADMITNGAGPQRSAFLSAFFTLVGCHGLHVTLGLLWLGTMMAQIFAKGFRPNIMRRLLCFSLFWHALDIIWVALFTIVYLMGATQ
jgi:cytochrome o ubiquinol oxidase subunit III